MTQVSAKILIEHGMGGRKKISCSDLLDWDIVRNQKNFCKSPEKDVMTLRSWKSTLVVILDIIYTTFNINLEKDILKENVDKKGEKVKEQEKRMEEGPEIVEEDVENVGEVGEMVVEDGDRVEEEEDWTGLEVEDQELRMAREKRMERLVREDKKRKEERDNEEREEMEMVE